MFSHVTVGANDFDAASRFYDRVMATLGHPCFERGDGYAGWGRRDGDQFWLVRPYDGAAASPGNGTMIALLAPDRQAVEAAHAAALGGGGSDEGLPGLRPHYHPNYYGAYFRDPEGNKLCVVCHRAP